MSWPLPASVDLDSLRFDPTQGTIIREPKGVGYGYWAGGHKVFYDAQTRQFVLFYRQRSPLELGRGGSCAIAWLNSARRRRLPLLRLRGHRGHRARRGATVPVAY